MKVLSILKEELVSYLIPLTMIFLLCACSTEESVNSTGSNTLTGATLSWVAPAERDDGTRISLSEIAGYRIYYGTSQGTYTDQININDGSADQATLYDLVNGTYYIVITTIDSDGRESGYSDEVVKSI